MPAIRPIARKKGTAAAAIDRPGDPAETRQKPSPFERRAMIALPRALLATALLLAAASAVAEENAAVHCLREANDGNIGACERAVAANPDDTVLRRRLALSMIVAGAAERSIDVYREAIRRAPDDAEAQYDLAAALGTLNRFPEAVAPIERALALEPDEPRYQRLADIVYWRVGAHDKLFRVTLREAERGDRIAMYEIALLYAEGIGVAADDGAALGWMKRAAERDHVGAMDRLSEVYLEGKLGQKVDPSEAEAWAAKARAARLATE
jgi:TPR repeat protein